MRASKIQKKLKEMSYPPQIKRLFKWRGISITPPKTNAPILETTLENLKSKIQTYQMRNKELKNETWTTLWGNIKSIFAI